MSKYSMNIYFFLIISFVIISLISIITVYNFKLGIALIILLMIILIIYLSLYHDTEMWTIMNEIHNIKKNYLLMCWYKAKFAIWKRAKQYKKPHKFILINLFFTLVQDFLTELINLDKLYFIGSFTISNITPVLIIKNTGYKTEKINWTA